MNGTEKQIKWATEIKANVMTALDAMANTSRKEEYAKFLTWIESKDSAAWWIENWKLTMTVNMFLRCAMLEYKRA